MLTSEQNKVYKDFQAVIIDKEIGLLSSEQRAWGKTYILNELGFLLQALEYRVFLLSEYLNHHEQNASVNLRCRINKFI